MKYDFLTVDFYPVMGMLFIIVFLMINARLERTVKRNLYIFSVIVLTELLVYNIELLLDHSEASTELHTYVTSLGYMIRPFLVYMFLVIVNRYNKSKIHMKLLLIPAFLNILYALLPYFVSRKYSFWYDENNVFHRGKFGWTPYLVILFYLISTFPQGKAG